HMELFDPAFVGTGAQAVSGFVADLLKSFRDQSVVGTNLDGTILFWSDGAHRAYGSAPDEVLTKLNCAALCEAEDAGTLRELMARARQHGESRGTLRLLTKNGEQF